MSCFTDDELWTIESCISSVMDNYGYSHHEMPDLLAKVKRMREELRSLQPEPGKPNPD